MGIDLLVKNYNDAVEFSKGAITTKKKFVFELESFMTSVGFEKGYNADKSGKAYSVYSRTLFDADTNQNVVYYLTNSLEDLALYRVNQKDVSEFVKYLSGSENEKEHSLPYVAGATTVLGTAIIITALGLIPSQVSDTFCYLTSVLAAGVGVGAIIHIIQKAQDKEKQREREYKFEPLAEGAYALRTVNELFNTPS